MNQSGLPRVYSGVGMRAKKLISAVAWALVAVLVQAAVTTPAHADMTRKEWLEKYGRLKSNGKDASPSDKSSGKSKKSSSDSKSKSKDHKDRDDARDRKDDKRDDNRRHDNKRYDNKRYDNKRYDNKRYDNKRYDDWHYDDWCYDDRYHYHDRSSSIYRSTRYAPVYVAPSAAAGSIFLYRDESSGVPYDGGYYPGYTGQSFYQGRMVEPLPQSATMGVVTAVQIGLARRGFDTGPADGKMGARTRAAIRAFQAAHRLPVSGQIDEPLLAALGLRVVR